MTTTTACQCTLCEAHCGILVESRGERVLRIVGDPDDQMSRGYICPKASALADLYADPDRLRRPVKRVGTEFVEIGWDEALTLAARGLRAVQQRYGQDAVALYLGNPVVHSVSALAAVAVRVVLGSRQNYSATSTDQLPQHLTSKEMLGDFALLPIPDIDRTDHLIVIGANPAVSNGSLMTAPGARRRIEAIMERGGQVVVVDPRRSETARRASRHVSVIPGGDPFLLLGMLHVIFDEGLEDVGRLAGVVDGLADVRELAAGWSPHRAEPLAGVDAETIAGLAREFAAARRAVVYGRVGVCQQVNGTITHWLINTLNVVTGNFDRIGGAMFPTPAVDISRIARIVTRWTHRYTQRVSGRPEMFGELPVAGLCDEIVTPGAGQVRGMLVYAGNPVLSAPGGARLDQAMEQLEWCVAVDMYATETTRHADVILPPLSHLERDDVDVVMPLLSVRNHLRYNPAAVPADPEGRTDWQILMGIAQRLGRGPIGTLRHRIVGLVSRIADHPDRIVDVGLRIGPYGLRRGRSGLSIAALKASPHGVDLGPLQPRLPRALGSRGKRLQLAPPAFLAEAGRLEQVADDRRRAVAAGHDLILIGRRHVRSNNSWMHNAPRLMKGADRCTARLHPDDATVRGLSHGDRVTVTSAIGSIEVPLEITDEIRPGVVSVPHGFGHTRPRVGWRVAAANAGASVNDITDPSLVDRLSGNAAFNAVPVSVQAARRHRQAPEEPQPAP